MKYCLYKRKQNSELTVPQSTLCHGSTSSGFQLTPSQAFSCESWETWESQQSHAGSQLRLFSIKPLHNRLWFTCLVFIAGLSISSFHPSCKAPAACCPDSCASSKTAVVPSSVTCIQTQGRNSAGQWKLSEALAQPQRRTFSPETTQREWIKQFITPQPLDLPSSRFFSAEQESCVCLQGFAVAQISSHSVLCQYSSSCRSTLTS